MLFADAGHLFFLFFILHSLSFTSLPFFSLEFSVQRRFALQSPDLYTSVFSSFSVMYVYVCVCLLLLNDKMKSLREREAFQPRVCIESFLSPRPDNSQSHSCQSRHLFFIFLVFIPLVNSYSDRLSSGIPENQSNYVFKDSSAIWKSTEGKKTRKNIPW